MRLKSIFYLMLLFSLCGCTLVLTSPPGEQPAGTPGGHHPADYAAHLHAHAHP